MKTNLKHFLLPVIYGILLAVLLVIPGQIAKPAHAQDSAYECWAVLVGISDYQNFTGLSYADDDAADLADRLSPVWGSDHIKLLTNSQATKQNIEDAMTDWLASRENENDVVLFYRSGFYWDTGYLLTYNSLTTSHSNDISASELNGLLNGLDSNKVVVINAPSGPIYDGITSSGRIIMAPNTGGEGSYSSTDLGHSIFTYYILEALSQFNDNSVFNLSAEDVFNYAKGKTTQYISLQHPQIYDGVQGDLTLLIKAKVDVESSATQASNILTIDGSPYSLSSLPKTFIWAPGSSHDIQATSTVSGVSGTRYVFDSWNDGNTSPSRTISSGGTYTADYNTQYYLTVNSAYGQPAGENWYNSGATAAISVVTPVEQAGTKRIFIDWSGDYTGSTASASVTMDKPKTVTASWRTQYYLTVTSVYGSPAGTGWYDSGSMAAISIVGLVEEPGTKHYFAAWSGDYTGNNASSSVPMNSPKTVNAEWSTEYLLTVVSEYGDAQGTGWYSSGSKATISVTSPVGAIVRKAFNGWTGDFTGNDVSSSVMMDQPKTVTANWKNDFLQLYILIIAIVVILGGLAAFWLLKIRKPKAPVVSSEAAPTPPSPKRCANCGAEIEAGDAFCIKCGKPVQDN